MPTKKETPKPSGTRRSARIVDAAVAAAAPKGPRKAAVAAKNAVAPSTAPKPKAPVKKAAPAAKEKAAPATKKKAAAAPKKTSAGKKRTKSDAESEDGEDEAESDAPAGKKAKKGEKAEKDEETDELASDAAEEEAEAEPSTAEAKKAAQKDSKIDIGSTIPDDITLKNEKDEDVNIKELSEKGLVVFLVPKANTPGCTTQACAFRDAYPDFGEVDYEVRCLSADSTTSQASWQKKQNLPYPLLSDPKRKLISLLGAGAGGKTTRSHFIFEKGSGKLIEKKVPVKAADSSKLALNFLQNIPK